MKKKYTWLLLFAIVLLAFSVRFAKIDNVPSGLFNDEAENGIDAINANSTGQYKLFYEGNNGREGLFINIQAISIKYLGINIIALKLPSIIFGTLTVLGMFFLNKELFGSIRAGLIGSYLIAFSYWAINFSRIGFRANMVPFILTWSFYFLFKGIRRKKYADFIFAGLIYGLGVHTYIAFRVSPLVLVALFCALLITRKGFLRNYWKHTLIFAVAMFITAMPMLLDFFVFHPEHYASRTSEISILNPQTNQGRLVPMLMETFALSLAKYSIWGDQNWRHNYPPYPLLNPIAGIAFLVGFFYVIFKFFHLAWLRFRRGVRDDKLHIYLFLLAWFFVLLIPEFLAHEGNPHALRAIGTLPVVFIIATIPFLWILGRAEKFGHFFKITILSLFAAAFIFIGLFDPIKYFVFFANNPKQQEAFDENLKTISYYINNLPASTKKYIVSDEYTSRSIKFLSAGTRNVFYTWPSHIEYIGPKDKDFVILLADPKQDYYKQIKENFPDLKTYEHKKSEKNFYIELKP